MNRILIPALLCALAVLSGCYNQILPEPPQVRQGVLPVAGADNIRDLGGIAGHDGRAVRWGLLVRSGSLEALSARDRDFLFGRGGMEIGTVVDFRCAAPLIDFGAGNNGLEVLGFLSSERDNALSRIPSGLLREGNTGIPESELISDFNTVIGDPDMTFDLIVSDISQRYRASVALHAEQYREFFRTLLEADGPVLFHCSTGKDRTGVAAALLLLALGVDEERIVTDYMFSKYLVHEKLFPVVSAIRRETARDMREMRPEAVRFADAVRLGNTAVIAEMEAAMRSEAGINVRRETMQGIFARIAAQSPGMSSDAAAVLARQQTEAADLSAAADAAFARTRVLMLEAGQVSDAEFNVWVEDFALSAGNRVKPSLTVFEQWIGAVLDEVSAGGGIEAFLDGVFPDAARGGVFVRDELRRLFLES